MTEPFPFVPLAEVIRNREVESCHLGAVVVVTPDGRLVASAGDPRIPTFIRSAAKPFQSLPLVLAGGEGEFDLSDADLAIICASHFGTPAHVDRVRNLLERGGFTGSDLRCGEHAPLDRDSARKLADGGTHPSTLHNNCSGKHAGMLLACRIFGFTAVEYDSDSHPLQRRIHREVATVCDLPEEEIGYGVDGCSLPAFRLPLVAAARGYAALADPAGASLDCDRRVAIDRIFSAMTGAPEMVAGPEQFTTRLMEVCGGRILGKEGAEGVYAVAVREPVPLGLAIKIADGGERCRPGVVLETLRRLGLMTGSELAELRDFHRPAIVNRRGEVVGRIEPKVELSKL